MSYVGKASLSARINDLGGDSLAPIQMAGKHTRVVQLSAAAASAGVSADAAPSQSAGSGRAIPEGPRAKMEQFFGRDFSAVRIHEGDQATSLGALAYTQGTDIHFAPGQYQPETASGQELLGHELAHVVQQADGRVQPTAQAKGAALNDSSALEAEADSMGATAGRSSPGSAGRGDRMGDWAASDVFAAMGLGAGNDHAAGTDCPTCGKASAGGACVQCQQAATTGVVQRQASAGGACHGTNRRAGPQHEAIQAHYIAAVDPTGVREYAIPAASSRGSGANGYADLASMGTGAIYEIKPYFPTEIAAGLAQVTGYVAAARASCARNIPWHPGFAYPDTVIPFGDRQLVAKQYGNPGLILYHVGPRNRPQPAPSRQQVLDVLLALGLSVALVAVVIAALADPEPASKLALAGLSVVMIGIILERFGLKEPDVASEA